MVLQIVIRDPILIFPFEVLFTYEVLVLVIFEFAFVGR